MSGLEIAALSRFLHIFSVIVLVGGSFFLRFIALPAVNSLPPDQQDPLRERLFKRWKLFVHSGLLFLILSGIYNVFLAMQLHRRDFTYHGLLGLKLLMAIGVIFIAIALTAKGEWSANLRKRSRLWLTLNLLLAIGVVAISGYLKVRGVPDSSPPPAAETSAS